MLQMSQLQAQITASVQLLVRALTAVPLEARWTNRTSRADMQVISGICTQAMQQLQQFHAVLCCSREYMLKRLQVTTLCLLGLTSMQTDAYAPACTCRLLLESGSNGLNRPHQSLHGTAAEGPLCECCLTASGWLHRQGAL